MNSLGETLSFLSSDSLFSTIITLYALLHLYFPSLFIRFVFSPVVLTTLFLLLYLLRLGATQNSASRRTESDSTVSSDPTQPLPQQVGDLPDRDHEKESSEPDGKHNSNLFYADSFVEWDVRAPLEVIYEENEGEDAEENDGVSERKRESEKNIIQRYASLSLFYPESDGDASSEEDYPTNGGWDPPENICFRWEEEAERDGLIEIALNGKTNAEVDDENLIEIDLFPAG